MHLASVFLEKLILTISTATFRIDGNPEKSIHLLQMEKQPRYMIGILGGGQLGCLLANAVQAKVNSWIIFCSHPDDPAFVFFPQHAMLLSEKSQIKREQLEWCEIIFLESEFNSYEELKNIRCKFIPDIENYKHFYGKINQRLFYQQLGLAQPDFWILNSPQDINELNEREIDYPVILKRNLFSYDGYGNREAKNQNELIHFADELGFPLLVEKKLLLKTEIAVGLVFDGNVVIELPLIETFQKNYICHYVMGPAILPPAIKQALNFQIELLKNSSLKGLFAFEFFITEDNAIFINEGAARPHNSQHLTMDLCHKSQFEYLVDLALGLPLEKSILKAPQGAMINLLGKKNIENPKLILPTIPASYPHNVYLYGKKQGRSGRKMGHLNILNPFQDENFIHFLDQLTLEYEL